MIVVPTNSPPLSRRRWQFGLRTLFLGTAAVATILAAIAGAFGLIPQAVIGGILALVIFFAIHVLAAAAIVLPVALALLGIRYFGTTLLKQFHI